MFKIPILLICFNRADHAQKVLERIVNARPKDLYVFRDHWREDKIGEKEKCEEVLQMVKELTDGTDITMHYLLPDKNLGCGPGPMTALNWFFSENEMGIVLEDDAVPHPDFFGYCEELLERYKEDESVRAIGSMNVDTHIWGDGSYYFSMMNRNLCAWASWRRAWSAFDFFLRQTKWQTLDKALKKYGCSFYEREYWLDRLKEVQKDGQGGNCWDMQFFMSIWLKGGKGIIPNVNLSSNIGTVGDATHQMTEGNIIDNVPTKPILPLTHPSSSSIQSGADREFHGRYFEPQRNDIVRFVAKVNKRIKRITGHEGPWRKRK